MYRTTSQSPQAHTGYYANRHVFTQGISEKTRYCVICNAVIRINSSYIRVGKHGIAHVKSPAFVESHASLTQRGPFLGQSSCGAMLIKDYRKRLLETEQHLSYLFGRDMSGD